MEESVTYRAMVARGMEQGAVLGLKRVILLQGRYLWGPPSAQVRTVLNTIEDLKELRRLSSRLLKVDSWQELLQPPRRRSRRKTS